MLRAWLMAGVHPWWGRHLGAGTATLHMSDAHSIEYELVCVCHLQVCSCAVTPCMHPTDAPSYNRSLLCSTPVKTALVLHATASPTAHAEHLRDASQHPTPSPPGSRAQNKLCNFCSPLGFKIHELLELLFLALPSPLRCASGPLLRAACIDYCACGHNACRAVCAPASRACVSSSVALESKLASETKTRSHTHAAPPLSISIHTHTNAK